MAGHGVGGAVRVVAADARADEVGADNPGDAADHVDGAAAGEVDHSDAEELLPDRLGAVRAEPAGGAPLPVGDDGVDEGSEEYGVHDVSVHLRAKRGAQPRSAGWWVLSEGTWRNGDNRARALVRSMTEPETMVVAVAAKVYWKNQVKKEPRGTSFTVTGGQRKQRANSQRRQGAGRQ